MHLSLNDVCLKSGSVVEKMRTIRRLGFPAVEVHYVNAAAAGVGPFREAARLFDVVTFHAPYIGAVVHPEEPAVARSALEQFTDVLRNSRDLGAEAVVFHAGKVDESEGSDKAEAAFASFMRDLDACAGECGVWACWETNADFLGRLERFELIRSLGLARTGICLDVAHLMAIRRQIDCPGNPTAVGAFLGRFAELVRCCHIHDWIDDDLPDPTRHDHYLIGQGCIDYREVFAAFAEAGLDCAVCMEYSSRMVTSLDALVANCRQVVRMAAEVGANLVVDNRLR